jgi:hypothetical protein
MQVGKSRPICSCSLAGLQRRQREGGWFIDENGAGPSVRLRKPESNALGFTVPLCRTHHRDIHSFGDEVSWWERRAIDPVAAARMLWISTRQIE